MTSDTASGKIYYHRVNWKHSGTTTTWKSKNKWKPKVKEVNQIDWDNYEADDHELFYIEKRVGSHWKFYRGYGNGEKALQMARRAIARLKGGRMFNQIYYRIVKVNTKFKEPICHAKR